MVTEFQKIRELNKFEGKSYRTFSTGNRDMKVTMVERLIGQLKLVISRVLNVLSDSDLGTYVTFLDAILKRYNESPCLQLGEGRMPFDVYRKGVVAPKNFMYKRFFNFRFLTRKILRKGQQVRVSVMKNLFQKRSSRQWPEEVFMIAKVYIMDPITNALEDLGGEPLEVAFYLEELKIY